MTTVSGAGVSSVNKDEWKVVAHEIGHNFGARHDCTGSDCPCSGSSCACCPCTDGCDCKSQFLMNPTSDVKSGDFSPCSRREVCQQFSGISACLVDTPIAGAEITIGMCGNGVREGNEECDCGTDEECAADPCCSKGCKLKSSAKCRSFFLIS
jgi:hypothetical protein